MAPAPPHFVRVMEERGDITFVGKKTSSRDKSRENFSSLGTRPQEQLVFISRYQPEAQAR